MTVLYESVKKCLNFYYSQEKNKHLVEESMLTCYINRFALISAVSIIIFFNASFLMMGLCVRVCAHEGSARGAQKVAMGPLSWR